jgi:hypothetical protein
MTSCTGCNVSLGFKKYNFQKQWRIPGYFCRECMKKMGQDFDDHGRITLPKRSCDSCHQNFYFLTTTWQNKKRHRCCDICKDIVDVEASSVKYTDEPYLPPVPSRVPIMMAIFAAFGVLLMLAGLGYVLLNADLGILHIIVGSSMTAGGFMLARKMVKVRNVILGKISTPQK